jgi:hypothetical protein
MRQWELIGITDNVPVATQPAPRPEPDVIIGHESDQPVFFRTTDGALR